jgi:hypothetical protein
VELEDHTFARTHATQRFRYGRFEWPTKLALHQQPLWIDACRVDDDFRSEALFRTFRPKERDRDAHRCHGDPVFERPATEVLRDARRSLPVFDEEAVPNPLLGLLAVVGRLQEA